MKLLNYDPSIGAAIIVIGLIFGIINSEAWARREMERTGVENAKCVFTLIKVRIIEEPECVVPVGFLALGEK